MRAEEPLCLHNGRATRLLSFNFMKPFELIAIKQMNILTPFTKWSTYAILARFASVGISYAAFFKVVL